MILAMIASWALALVFLLLNIWNLATGRKWLAQRDEARCTLRRLEKRVNETDQRALDYADRLDDVQEQNEALTTQLQEADAQLKLSVEEIHALQKENKSLVLQLQEATKTRTTSRARGKARLISGQANAAGEDGAV